MNQPAKRLPGRAVVLLLVLAALIGVRALMSYLDRRAGSRIAELAPLPSPDLSRLEPAIQEQIAAAREQVEVDPSDFEANVRLGMCYHAHGLLDAAGEVYRRAIALAADVFEIHYYYALACEQAGDLDTALAACRRVTELQPNCQPAWLLLGKLHWARGDLQQAESIFARIRQDDQGCAAGYFWLGRVLAKRGDLDRAIADFEVALSLAPDHPDLLYALGMALRDRGDDERAVQLLSRSQTLPRRALYADPYRAQLDRLRTGAEQAFQAGYHLSEAGRFEEAVGYYQQALGVDPNLVEARQNLGVAFLRLNRLDEAVEQLRLAVQADPSLSQAHTNLGNALARLGETDQAGRSYAESARLDPQNPAVQNDYANFLMSIGDFHEAVRRYREAIRLAPGDLPPRVNLAIGLHNLERVDEAVEAYHQALNIAPGATEIGRQLYELLESLGRYGEAMGVLRQVLEAVPGHPAAAERLAWLLATAPDDALRDGDQAVALASSVCQASESPPAGVLLTLAAAYAESGRFDAALATLQRARRQASTDGDTEALTAVDHSAALYAKRRPYRLAP